MIEKTLTKEIKDGYTKYTPPAIKNNKSFILYACAKENAHHLPATTQFIAIEGENHRQFADYQNQKGDLEATISQDAQHTAILKAIYTFLQT